MLKSVFISRDLDYTSEFAALLTAAGWQVRGLSLVTLTALPVGEIPKADWIFFASKNAVRYFFEGIEGIVINLRGEGPPGVSTPSPPPKGRGACSRSTFGIPNRDGWVKCGRAPLPFGGGDGGGVDTPGEPSTLKLMAIGLDASILWAALGPATARELQRYVGRVDFTGTGDPDSTAAAFLPLARGKRVLFPAARHSQKSIAEILGDAITALHLAVYDNAPASGVPPLTESVLVFTSPMNARAYFSRHALQPGQRVVAIGRTTAAALTKLGMPQYVVSEYPNERALAETVLAFG